MASGSGEWRGDNFNLLLDMIKEMKKEQQDFRGRVEEKLDESNTEMRKVLVRLAEGTGRMDNLAGVVDGCRRAIDDVNDRIRSIERGSGMRSAIHLAAAPADDKPSGGWISADKLPALIAAIGSVIAVILSSVAMMRAPAEAPTVAQAPPPAVKSAP